MRIAIDARAWGWTGVGRYIRELVREYARLPHSHTFVLLLPEDVDVIAQARELTKSRQQAFEYEIIGSDYYSWGEQVKLPFRLAKVKADLFHFPHFNVPIFFNRPYVVTIHDATRFYFPGQRRQGLLNQLAYELVFNNAVRSAKHVICVSEYTMNELQALRVLQVPHPNPLLDPPAGGGEGNNMKVIHEGVSDEFFKLPTALDRAKIRALLDTKDPYLLSVGVWMSHKNLPRVLQAFKEIHIQHPKLKLVMTGKPVPAYINMIALARSLGILDNVIFPGFVPHDLLPALYVESTALLFPSLYEGFGLPALEAAALGVPVITSSVTSLPEIMGDAAQYVNPENIQDIVRGIKEVLEDDTLRATLRSKGIEQAATFSWKACAEQTLAIYTTCREVKIR